MTVPANYGTEYRSTFSDSALIQKSYLFIENYYLIIVLFYAHISDIFIYSIQKKTIKVSTQGPLTLKYLGYSFDISIFSINNISNEFLTKL